MKNIAWDDFKTTLIAHDPQYAEVFERLEQESDKDKRKLLFNLEDMDEVQNYKMMKEYLICKGLTPESVAEDYKKRFHQRVMDLSPDVPDTYFDTFWKYFNPLGFLETSMDRKVESVEMHANTFNLLYSVDFLEVYLSLLEKKEK